jgi:ABC-2 type transport system ATP-binding protein
MRQTGEQPSNTEASGVVISVQGLRMHYGAMEAVRGIDFVVQRGEVVALLGPNGAGKTTTLEILEGFRQRTAGAVRVLGADPGHAGRGWRARIGIVLQESQPEPDLTVAQCLSLYAGYYPAPRPVDETLALVGLADRRHVHCGRLSGGQRRRLDVALALIGDPELIFLDEPTTGFDPAARRATWAVIAGLRDLGKTIVLTTHYLEEAEQLADRILVIAQGRIAAAGTPATLGGRDTAAAVIRFRLPTGVLAGRLPPALAVLALPQPGGYVELHTRQPLPCLSVLAAWAADAGVAIAELHVAQPTLEDIYLQLTTGTTTAGEASAEAAGWQEEDRAS